MICSIMRLLRSRRFITMIFYKPATLKELNIRIYFSFVEQR